MQPDTELDFGVKAAVGVSSRNFKKAVQRNRIKRLLREGYRTEKLPLHQHLEQTHKQLIIFILYIDKVMPDYKTIKEKMPFIVERLIKKLDEAIIENT